ncbi:uncharacterized protein METZ01_LOCUS130688 [marine metagenome]|uniref:Uncharacterized protein n=1 Tax=marine metagenome TaxID=408172 RepID=A0A381YLE9_9ZZZZ
MLRCGWELGSTSIFMQSAMFVISGGLIAFTPNRDSSLGKVALYQLSYSRLK